MLQGHLYMNAMLRYGELSLLKINYTVVNSTCDFIGRYAL